MSHSITCLRKSTASSSVVDTTMPSCASVMQLICTPLTGPSTNFTAHTRQAPTGPRAGWKQNRGMIIPSRAAASITFVPFGTSISNPSIFSLGIISFSTQLSPVTLRCLRLRSGEGWRLILITLYGHFFWLMCSFTSSKKLSRRLVTGIVAPGAKAQ